MTDLPESQSGFTLVEMLVALVIFSLLSAAGVIVLRSSLSAQEGVVTRLDQQSGQARMVALLRDDISQSIARPLTGLGDTRSPSFEGDASVMKLVKGGWSNPGEQPRSALQRVQWTLKDGKIARIAHLFLDGSDPGQAAAMIEATALRFEYRQGDGGWSDRFVASERELLPSAVRATIEQGSGGNLVVVAALPPRGLEPARPTPVDPLQPQTVPTS